MFRLPWIYPVGGQSSQSSQAPDRFVSSPRRPRHENGTGHRCFPIGAVPLLVREAVPCPVPHLVRASRGQASLVAMAKRGAKTGNACGALRPFAKSAKLRLPGMRSL
jgi:hypothetical protein